MKFRPIQAFFIFLLAAGLISACQPQTEKETATASPTRAGGTPSVEVRRTTQLAGTKTPPSPAPSPTPILGVDLKNLEGTVISFWHPWQGDLAKRAQEAAQEFNKTNEWGLKVEVTSFYNAAALYDAVNEARGLQKSEETQTAKKTLAPGGGREPEGNEGPGIVAATSDQLASWTGGSVPVAVDLTPYIHAPQSGISEEEISSYLPAFWQQDTHSEKQIGLPALRGAQVLFYNQTWAKELGFPRSPETPREFKEQACAAAVANNTAKRLDLYGTGGWMVDTNPLTTLSWMAAFGANPVPQSDGQPYRFASEEAEEAVSFLQDMVSDGCAWLGKDMQPYETFIHRKALFYTGTLADIRMQDRWHDQLKSTDSWTVLPFPGNDGKQVVFSSGYSYGILKSSPEVQMGAWLFARWLSQPESSGKLAEAMPSLPVTTKIHEQISAKSSRSPWDKVLPLTDGIQAAPSISSWRLARRALEDAAWQVYHIPSEEKDQILPQLDETVEELLKE